MRKTILFLFTIFAIFILASCERGEGFYLLLPEEVTANVENLNDVKRDSTVTLTVNVPEGKTIEFFYVNGIAIELINNQYTFTITRDTIVLIEYEGEPLFETYKLTLSEGLSTPLTDLTAILVGTEITVTITVPAGKEIDSFKVNGVETAITGTTYKFEITKDANIVVTFKDLPAQETYYKLTLGEGLSTTIVDRTKILEDTEVTVTVTVPDGKEIDSFKVNGVETIITGTTYTFTITKDTNIVVTFKDLPVPKTYYKLTLSEGLLADDIVDLTEILEETEVTVTVTVPDGKEIDSFKVNNVETAITGTTYKFGITKDTNIVVTFKDLPVVEKYYKLTLSATLSANVTNLTEILEGTEVVVTAMIPEGKVIESFKVNGVETAITGTTYTFTITEDTNIVVTYKDEIVDGYFTKEKIVNMLNNYSFNYFQAGDFKYKISFDAFNSYAEMTFHSENFNFKEFYFYVVEDGVMDIETYFVDNMIYTKSGIYVQKVAFDFDVSDFSMNTFSKIMMFSGNSLFNEIPFVLKDFNVFLNNLKSEILLYELFTNVKGYEEDGIEYLEITIDQNNFIGNISSLTGPETMKLFLSFDNEDLIKLVLDVQEEIEFKIVQTDEAITRFTDLSTYLQPHEIVKLNIYKFGELQEIYIVKELLEDLLRYEDDLTYFTNVFSDYEEGYSFLGYYMDEDFTIPLTHKTKIEDELTLYLKFGQNYEVKDLLKDFLYEDEYLIYEYYNRGYLSYLETKRYILYGIDEPTLLIDKEENSFYALSEGPNIEVKKIPNDLVKYWSIFDDHQYEQYFNSFYDRENNIVIKGEVIFIINKDLMFYNNDVDYLILSKDDYNRQYMVSLFEEILDLLDDADESMEIDNIYVERYNFVDTENYLEEIKVEISYLDFRFEDILANYIHLFDSHQVIQEDGKFKIELVLDGEEIIIEHRVYNSSLGKAIYYNYEIYYLDESIDLPPFESSIYNQIGYYYNGKLFTDLADLDKLYPEEKIYPLQPALEIKEYKDFINYFKTFESFEINGFYYIFEYEIYYNHQGYLQVLEDKIIYYNNKIYKEVSRVDIDYYQLSDFFGLYIDDIIGVITFSDFINNKLTVDKYNQMERIEFAENIIFKVYGENDFELWDGNYRRSVWVSARDYNPLNYLETFEYNYEINLFNNVNDEIIVIKLNQHYGSNPLETTYSYKDYLFEGYYLDNEFEEWFDIDDYPWNELETYYVKYIDKPTLEELVNYYQMFDKYTLENEEYKIQLDRDNGVFYIYFREKLYYYVDLEADVSYVVRDNILYIAEHNLSLLANLLANLEFGYVNESLEGYRIYFNDYYLESITLHYEYDYITLYLENDTIHLIFDSNQEIELVDFTDYEIKEIELEMVEFDDLRYIDIRRIWWNDVKIINSIGEFKWLDLEDFINEYANNIVINSENIYFTYFIGEEEVIFDAVEKGIVVFDSREDSLIEFNDHYYKLSELEDLNDIVVGDEHLLYTINGFYYEGNLIKTLEELEEYYSWYGIYNLDPAYTLNEYESIISYFNTYEMIFIDYNLYYVVEGEFYYYQGYQGTYFKILDDKILFYNYYRYYSEIPLDSIDYIWVEDIFGLSKSFLNRIFKFNDFINNKLTVDYYGEEPLAIFFEEDITLYYYNETEFRFYDNFNDFYYWLELKDYNYFDEFEVPDFDYEINLLNILDENIIIIKLNGGDFNFLLEREYAPGNYVFEGYYLDSELLELFDINEFEHIEFLKLYVKYSIKPTAEELITYYQGFNRYTLENEYYKIQFDRDKGVFYLYLYDELRYYVNLDEEIGYFVVDKVLYILEEDLTPLVYPFDYNNFDFIDDVGYGYLIDGFTSTYLYYLLLGYEYNHITFHGKDGVFDLIFDGSKEIEIIDLNEYEIKEIELESVEFDNIQYIDIQRIEEVSVVVVNSIGEFKWSDLNQFIYKYADDVDINNENIYFKYLIGEEEVIFDAAERGYVVFDSETEHLVYLENLDLVFKLGDLEDISDIPLPGDIFFSISKIYYGWKEVINLQDLIEFDPYKVIYYVEVELEISNYEAITQYLKTFNEINFGHYYYPEYDIYNLWGTYLEVREDKLIIFDDYNYLEMLLENINYDWIADKFHILKTNIDLLFFFNRFINNELEVIDYDGKFIFYEGDIVLEMYESKYFGLVDDSNNMDIYFTLNNDSYVGEVEIPTYNYEVHLYNNVNDEKEVVKGNYYGDIIYLILGYNFKDYLVEGFYLNSEYTEEIDIYDMEATSLLELYVKLGKNPEAFELVEYYLDFNKYTLEGDDYLIQVDKANKIVYMYVNEILKVYVDLENDITYLVEDNKLVESLGSLSYLAYIFENLDLNNLEDFSYGYLIYSMDPNSLKYVLLYYDKENIVISSRNEYLSLKFYTDKEFEIIDFSSYEIIETYLTSAVFHFYSHIDISKLWVHDVTVTDNFENQTDISFFKFIEKFGYDEEITEESIYFKAMVDGVEREFDTTTGDIIVYDSAVDKLLYFRGLNEYHKLSNLDSLPQYNYPYGDFINWTIEGDYFEFEDLKDYSEGEIIIDFDFEVINFEEIVARNENRFIVMYFENNEIATYYNLVDDILYFNNYYGSKPMMLIITDDYYELRSQTFTFKESREVFFNVLAENSYLLLSEKFIHYIQYSLLIKEVFNASNQEIQGYLDYYYGSNYPYVAYEFSDGFVVELDVYYSFFRFYNYIYDEFYTPAVVYLLNHDNPSDLYIDEVTGYELEVISNLYSIIITHSSIESILEEHTYISYYENSYLLKDYEIRDRDYNLLTYTFIDLPEGSYIVYFEYELEE